MTSRVLKIVAVIFALQFFSPPSYSEEFEEISELRAAQIALGIMEKYGVKTSHVDITIRRNTRPKWVLTEEENAKLLQALESRNYWAVDVSVRQDPLSLNKNNGGYHSIFLIDKQSGKQIINTWSNRDLKERP